MANVSVCAPGGPATLTVSPVQPGVAYAWYDSPTATAPLVPATAASFTLTIPSVTAATTYYVQALPAGAFGCPSDYRPVTVTLQSVTLPTVAVPPSVVLGNTLSLNFAGLATYTYAWDWGDGTALSTAAGPALAFSHLYAPAPNGAAATYRLVLTVRDDHRPAACEATATYTLVVADKLCEVALPGGGLAGLRVRRDYRTGSYSFRTPAECGGTTPVLFDCLTGAPTAQPDAVAASAVAFAEGPAAADPAYGLASADIAANPFLAGAGRPHPEATHAYATPVDDAPTRSTERGRFALVPFNWQAGARHRLPAWQPAGRATRFAPDGQAVEERDILGIPSAVKLGYAGGPGYAGGVLPYLTAKNAAFADVLFESFETLPATGPLTGEDNFVIDPAEARLDADYAHAGRHSLELLPAGPGWSLTLPARLLPAAGGRPLVKFWVRVSPAAAPDRALGRASLAALAAAPLAVRWVPGQETPAQVVAQTGEWQLCEAVMTDATRQAIGPNTFAPQLVATGLAGHRVWVDDVRQQPEQAQLAAYVYDPATRRLLASFDDQHFGLYYQYNAEGKLVRKQIETERGQLTVQETQYNTPK